jgi:hypothetical protein
MTTREPAGMPHHVGDAVATIAALHAAHDREARALQRAVARATSGIAQPGTLILITLAIAIWVKTNLTLPELGHAALDPFPSGYTQGANNAGAGNSERAEIVQDHSAPRRISSQ